MKVKNIEELKVILKRNMDELYSYVDEEEGDDEELHDAMIAAETYQEILGWLD